MITPISCFQIPNSNSSIVSLMRNEEVLLNFSKKCNCDPNILTQLFFMFFNCIKSSTQVSITRFDFHLNRYDIIRTSYMQKGFIGAMQQVMPHLSITLIFVLCVLSTDMSHSLILILCYLKIPQSDYIPEACLQLLLKK